jgi:hypothetical protein
MLDELYAQLPGLQCKGLCHDSCTVTDGSELERQRVIERGTSIGPAIGPRTLKAMIAAGNRPRCPALGPLNNCTVYDVRPLLCRVYGLTEGSRCQHGCVPDWVISDGAMLRAFRAVEELSVRVTGVLRKRPL